MQGDEERKARMRAYYRKNKDKWKVYKQNKLASCTDDQQVQERLKRLEYHREYYQKHRRKIIARTRRYQNNNRQRFVAYRARYLQENKELIHASRREHYHTVVKPRAKDAKRCSEFVSISEAVQILGAKLRTFREWVYRGSIASVRTPGGRYLLRRSEVEELRNNIFHLPLDIRKKLGIGQKEEKQ